MIFLCFFAAAELSAHAAECPQTHFLAEGGGDKDKILIGLLVGWRVGVPTVLQLHCYHRYAGSAAADESDVRQAAGKIGEYDSGARRGGGKDITFTSL